MGKIANFSVRLVHQDVLLDKKTILEAGQVANGVSSFILQLQLLLIFSCEGQLVEWSTSFMFKNIWCLIMQRREWNMSDLFLIKKYSAHSYVDYHYISKFLSIITDHVSQHAHSPTASSHSLQVVFTRLTFTANTFSHRINDKV